MSGSEDFTPPTSSRTGFHASSMEQLSVFEKLSDTKSSRRPFPLSGFGGSSSTSISQSFRKISSYSTESGEASVSKVSASGETIKMDEGYNKLDYFRNVLSENRNGTASQELAKAKEAAKSELRVQAEEKQRGHIVAEARLSEIVEASKSLLVKTVLDVRETLKQEYSNQMNNGVGTLHHEVSAVSKKVALAELKEELAPKVMAELKEELEPEAQNIVVRQLNEELRDEFISLKGSLEVEVISSLTPKVTATLREELAQPVTATLKAELVETVKATLKEELAETVTATLKEELAEPVATMLEQKLTEPVTARLEQKLTEPVTAMLEQKLTELITAGLEQKLTPSVTDRLEQKLTEPVRAMLEARLAEQVTEEYRRKIKAEAIAEYKGDLQNAAKIELEKLEQKAQKLSDELDEEKVHENDHSPPHQSVEYEDASKHAYHPQTSHHDIDIGEQMQPTSPKDAVHYQSEGHEHKEIPLGEQIQPTSPGDAERYQSVEYDQSETNLGDKVHTDAPADAERYQSVEYDQSEMKLGEKLHTDSPGDADYYQSEEYDYNDMHHGDAEHYQSEEYDYNDMHHGDAEHYQSEEYDYNDMPHGDAEDYQSEESEEVTPPACKATTINDSVQLGKQQSASPFSSECYKSDEYNDVAKSTYYQKSMSNNRHVGEQPSSSSGHSERYQSQTLRNENRKSDHHPLYPSLHYDHEESSVQKYPYEHLYPINGNGSRFAAVKGNIRPQSISPSRGIKRARDEHEDDQGDRWGSSPKRTCDDLGTSEKYDKPYSSPGGTKRTLDEDDRWGASPKRSRSRESSGLFLSDDEVDPRFKHVSSADEEEDERVTADNDHGGIGDEGYEEEGEYDELDLVDYSSDESGRDASVSESESGYRLDSRLAAQSRSMPSPKYSVLDQRGSSLENAIELDSGSDSDNEEPATNVRNTIEEVDEDDEEEVDSHIGEDDLPDYDSDEEERP